MWTALRAATYGTLFTLVWFVLGPALVLRASGFTAIPPIGPLEALSLAVAAVGALIALACVVAFVRAGRGTPAPFDPPRRLVAAGPYRYVRNPMYVGAALGLAGVAGALHSPALLAYTAALVLLAHVFIVVYEEPTLVRLFGDEYVRYRATTGRWWPRWGGRGSVH